MTKNEYEMKADSVEDFSNKFVASLLIGIDKIIKATEDTLKDDNLSKEERCYKDGMINAFNVSKLLIKGGELGVITAYKFIRENAQLLSDIDGGA